MLSLSAAAACISTATSRGVLGPLSGDDSCKPLVQFKGWLECNKTVLKADQDERQAFRNIYIHNISRCWLTEGASPMDISCNGPAANQPIMNPKEEDMKNMTADRVCADHTKDGYFTPEYKQS